MKTKISIFLLIAQLSVFAQNTKSIHIIPKPAQVSYGTEVFNFDSKTVIVMHMASRKSDVIGFIDYVTQNYGFKNSIQPQIRPNQTNIVINYVKWLKNTPEKYELKIEKNLITISAQENTSGIFYAFQTLMQLVSSSPYNAATAAVNLPCLTIKDEPLYAWRGMHLDVGRHFFSKEFIKKYIDIMAMYKLNTFHWHLTEDQGWRIEIKKYPRLTQLGAWRKGTMVGKYDDHKFDSIRYGGFYTQEDIKEIVRYAEERHITIVPEIEMPGHSVAAIASYPFLSCTGKKIEVEKSWGVFNDVYCTKDSTFKFLEDVLTEVMDLFPGKYIHIGGDECPMENWKKCASCQAVKKREGLKNENQLQSYFIKRIEKFVNARGRQIIGWDEILDGGLAPNAAVMSWRGNKGGIAAARLKHNVVMSPGKPCYFDHYQSLDKDNEPLAIGGFNPLDSVYAFNPTPKSLALADRRYIMGAQGNVWTEYILTEKQVEYMAVPRLCALAEALWLPPQQKNYNDFVSRLKVQSKMLEKMDVNFAKHFLSPQN